MFIAKSPLRLSLGGGGTDLPSYYRKRGGYLIAGAINKYVYTSIIKSFDVNISLTSLLTLSNAFLAYL